MALERMEMGLRCPKCSHELSPWSIRDEFACAHCDATLSANATGRKLLALIVWVVLDFPLILVAHLAAGDTTSSYFLYYVVPSALLGIAIFWVVFSGASVSLRQPQSNGV
jgi:hypothetical protein